MFQLSPLIVSPEILVAKGGTMWARNGRWILPEMPDFHVAFRNLLHAVNLLHGTGGFTSPPKEGVLRIFSPWKIRRLRPGLNPRTWVPKASTLPLDHRSRAYQGMDILVSDVQKMTEVAWLQYVPLQNTFILCLSPKASTLNSKSNGFIWGRILV